MDRTELEMRRYTGDYCRVRTIVLASIVIAAALSAPATAQLKSWNAGDGLWNNAGNWFPVGLPGPANQVFVGNLPAAENEWVTLNVNSLIASLSITNGMALSTSNGQLVVTGATTIFGKNSDGNTTYPSRVIVENGPAAIDAVLASVTVSDEGWLQLAGGTVLANGVVTIGSTGALIGDGTLSLGSNAPVALLVDGFLGGSIPGKTINQLGTGLIDLDGSIGGDSILNVTLGMADGTDFGKLFINGTALADPMDDDIWLSRGNRLAMNLSNGWSLGPLAEIRVFGGNARFPATRLTGDLLTLNGTLFLSSTNSLLQLEAPLNVAPSATVNMAGGAVLNALNNATLAGGTYILGDDASLRFNATTTVNGGTFLIDGFDGEVQFNGPTSWNGSIALDGRIVITGDASVVGPTVVNGGNFDMDGIFGDTEWSIGNSLVLNVESIDAVGSIFNGQMIVGGTAFAKLTVNLDVPAAAWTVGPVPAKLSLGGFGGFFTTRVEGSPLRVQGQLEVTNAVRIAADTRLENGSLIVFTTPTSRLRFSANTFVGSGAGFFGEGRIENQVGGTMRLAPSLNTFPTDLLNAGTLHIAPLVGDAAGVAMTNLAVFEETSTWRVDIGGANPGIDHDQLMLLGGAHTIDGALDVRLLDAGDRLFAPTIGETFVILTAPPLTLSGAFDDGPITTVPAKSYLWTVGYATGEVFDIVTLTLADIFPCPADLNGDGMVDGADLGLMLNSWGPCADCLADLGGDGVVDGGDLGLLLTAWGACPLK